MDWREKILVLTYRKAKCMGVWVGRIGKVINSIKKDGLGGGLRKSFEGLKTLSKSVEPGDVLFVTGGVGRSAQYRCHNQAEELTLHGILASVAMQDNPKLMSLADQFKVFIFHRTLQSEKLVKFVEKIKQQNKTILFETDDLNYDPEHLQKTDYFQNINDLERKQIENGIGVGILTDEYVAHCVASTTFLGEKLRERGKEVFVSKNKLSKEEVENALRISEKLKVREEDTVKIGYFSGTPSHDKDFKTVEKILVKLLKKHKNLVLFLAGPLELGKVFEEVKDQIEHVKFASMEQHWKNLAGVDINIVPLEDNDFCRAKSEIKFIGAGIVGVPTVALNNQTFWEVIEDGFNGCLVSSEQEWEEKFERLITDKQFRLALGKHAKETVLEKHTSQSEGNVGYYNFLKKEINKK